MQARYPEDATANLEDFRRSGWESAISFSDRLGYHYMWGSLSEAARIAVESGDTSKGKVLWLLADACSMKLEPSSANEPFRPRVVGEGQRTSLSDDFLEPDVELLAQISGEVENPWLQARLADLVWLLKRPRSPSYALFAIDAYRRIPLDGEAWKCGGQECWERAIRLSLTLFKAGGSDRIGEIENSIFGALKNANEDDGFFALWLSELLLANNLGRDKRAEIAEKLQSLARVFELHSSLSCARDFFAAAAEWFRKAGEREKETEMIVCLAESWTKEAMASTQNMVAVSFYENALQAYRRIPRAERVLRKIDGRLTDLYKHLGKAGEGTLDEMGVVESPPTDISEFVERARKMVEGKDLNNALLALANIYPGFQIAQVRQQARKMISRFPIQGLFSATYFSVDGRVIAKRPGMDSGDDDGQSAIWSQMIRDFEIGMALAVQGRILPALEIVVLEHRLREQDFIFVAGRSPIVPAGRARLFGKALFGGYERDFAQALHILVPQIEQMVRSPLKRAGVKITNLDRNGIENEIGLSSLMDLPEVGQIFGEDVAFEIKALFCDPLGPNLRNELAHGLLDDHRCVSVYSVYAWWLGLKLVFNTYWNWLHDETPMGGQGGSETEEG